MSGAPTGESDPDTDHVTRSGGPATIPQKSHEEDARQQDRFRGGEPAFRPRALAPKSMQPVCVAPGPPGGRLGLATSVQQQVPLL